MGIYTVLIAETVSGKVFEISFEFYREDQKNIYSIEFHANCGEGIMENQSIELNSSTNLRKKYFL